MAFNKVLLLLFLLLNLTYGYGDNTPIEDSFSIIKTDKPLVYEIRSSNEIDSRRIDALFLFKKFENNLHSRPGGLVEIFKKSKKVCHDIYGKHGIFQSNDLKFYKQSNNPSSPAFNSCHDFAVKEIIGHLGGYDEITSIKNSALNNILIKDFLNMYFTQIPYEEAKKGDLLLYMNTKSAIAPSHSSVYLGNHMVKSKIDNIMFCVAAHRIDQIHIGVGQYIQFWRKKEAKEKIELR